MKDPLFKYTFIKDKEQFYTTKTKQPVQESLVRRHLEKSNAKYAEDIDALKEAIQELKDFGTTYDEFKGRTGVAAELAPQLYAEIESEMSFKWLCDSVSGDAMYYVKEDNSAVPLGVASSTNFCNAIRADRSRLAFLRNHYNNSPILSKLKRKIGFEQYLTILYNEFKYDASRALDTAPVAISWSKDTLAYMQFNPDNVKPGSTAAWDEFLDRLDFPNVFLAWVWSIFDPNNFGRQALWMYSQGNDGKSAVINALMNIIGNINTCALDNSKFKSQFFFSNVHGKRFTVYGDCKIPRLISYEKIHSLLGGDLVPIEKKGEDTFMSRVHSRLLVAANNYPEIDFSRRNELSRLIVISLSPISNNLGDNNFEARLYEEKWAFLHRCREQYELLFPTGVDMKVPEEVLQKMENRSASLESDVIAEFIEDKLTFGEKLYITKSNMFNELDDYFRDRGLGDKAKFATQSLEQRVRQHGVEVGKFRVNVHGTMMRKSCWKGVGIKRRES